MLVELDEQDELNHDSKASRRVDQMVKDLFTTHDQESAPDHQGRFPSVIRTHTVISDEKKKTMESWPGSEPKCSWITHEQAHSDVVIASIGPESVDTASQVRWLTDVVQNLDAITDKPAKSGVLTKGYMYPRRVVGLLDSVSGVDLAISNLVDRFEWEVSRTPFGLRGYIDVQLIDFANKSNLGMFHSEDSDSKDSDSK